MLLCAVTFVFFQVCVLPVVCFGTNKVCNLYSILGLCPFITEVSLECFFGSSLSPPLNSQSTMWNSGII